MAEHETIMVSTVDGERLEAVVHRQPGATGVVIVCHPHPEHGGTMDHPLVDAITARASAAGWDVLRFNFRGIGASTGIHGHGVDEVNDVAAVVAAMEARDVPVIGITGWSFGAATALVWHTAAQSTIAYVGIAPPVRSPLTPALPDPRDIRTDASRTFIIGERDQFVDVGALAQYAASIGAHLLRYATADHFFVARYDRVADDVVAAIGS